MGCFFGATSSESNGYGYIIFQMANKNHTVRKSAIQILRAKKTQTAWKRTHPAVSTGFSLDLELREIQTGGSSHASALAFGKALAACST